MKPNTPQELAPVLQKLIKPFIEKALKEKNADRDMNNHVQAAADGLNVLFFPLSPTPSASIKEYIEQTDFYGNKVLMLKKPADTAWWMQYKELLKSLHMYVQENFTTGLRWNH